jgi:hypothetical protein
MTEPQEIPQLTTELIDMSREYLRQETIEPAKRLGKHAGLGIGGAVVVAIGVVCLAWGLYYGLTQLFSATVSDNQWWVVLSRFITALVTAGVAGIIVWRMQSDDYEG